MKLCASGEDYLKGIYILQRRMGLVRSVDLSRHRGYSKPSICHAVANLREGGYVIMDDEAFGVGDLVNYLSAPR